MKTLTWLGVLCLALAGCDAASDEEPPSVLPFQTIEEAAGFRVTQAGAVAIRDRAAWRALWEATWSIFDERGQKTPPPGVDFDRTMVIAVFWGEGFSGCSNGVAAIESVIQRDGELVVRVGSLPDLGPCDALVYPIQMVRVERLDLPVVFLGDVPR